MEIEQDKFFKNLWRILQRFDSSDNQKMNSISNFQQKAEILKMQDHMSSCQDGAEFISDQPNQVSQVIYMEKQLETIQSDPINSQIHVTSQLGGENDGPGQSGGMNDCTAKTSRENYSKINGPSEQISIIDFYVQKGAGNYELSWQKDVYGIINCSRQSDGKDKSNFQLTLPDWMKMKMEIQFSFKFQKALLLGGPGVGKSTIFKVFTQNEQSNQQQMEFPCSTDFNIGFILFDSPSFQMNSSTDKQNRILNSFKYFLNSEQHNISTFFLVIKYEKLELMKKNFYDVAEYFWNLKNNIVILITLFNEKEQIENKTQIEKFFKANGIQKILYFKKSNSSVAIKQKLRSGLTGRKGINLQNTAFQMEEKQARDIFFQQ